MLPPGVLHMSALGRFGRFTLFSPRVSHSNTCRFFVFVCVVFFVALLCFCFLFCKCFGIPNSPRSLDLDDRQGLISSSAMQQKKNSSPSCPHLLLILRPCRPPSNNFEHLSALKLKWHRSHANPFHVVPLPLN